jgi:hypothetical protein
MTSFALILAKIVVTGGRAVGLEVVEVTSGLSLEEALFRLATRPRRVAAIIRRLPAELPTPGDVLERVEHPLSAAQARAMVRRAQRRREALRAWG